MATYMFMLFDDEGWWDNLDDTSWHDAMSEHEAFGAAVVAAGASIVSGEALQRSTTAKVVRRSTGSASPVITDGPFAEAKEVFGGYYVIEASDLDQALELAALCPSTIIEVRPILATDGDSPR